MLHAGGGTEALEDVHVWRESNRFGDLERAALAYSEAVARTDLDVDDETFGALRARLSEAQLVELTAWIGLEALYASFNRAFRVEAQGWCRIPWAAHDRGD